MARSSRHLTVFGQGPKFKLRHYQAKRLRMARQVRYSLHSENSIALVLFFNGIPITTVELKSDYTPQVQDTVDQYRFDRLPEAAGRNSEVQMRTRLAGPDSRFLPFNRGDNFGAGNPAKPNGGEDCLSQGKDLATRQLARHSWPLSGAGEGREEAAGSWIFQRVHQLDANRKLVAQVLADGPGGKYLIEHSAG